jgi:hypothetical protein
MTFDQLQAVLASLRPSQQEREAERVAAAQLMAEAVRTAVASVKRSRDGDGGDGEREGKHARTHPDGDGNADESIDGGDDRPVSVLRAGDVRQANGERRLRAANMRSLFRSDA